MKIAGFILLFIVISFFTCQKKDEHQNPTLVKFEQKPFAEILSMAAGQNKRILVDFWSHG
jgi:hypothetical protein